MTARSPLQPLVGRRRCRLCMEHTLAPRQIDSQVVRMIIDDKTSESRAAYLLPHFLFRVVRSDKKNSFYRQRNFLPWRQEQYLRIDRIALSWGSREKRVKTTEIVLEYRAIGVAVLSPFMEIQMNVPVGVIAESILNREFDLGRQVCPHQTRSHGGCIPWT
jgi:hypothetical protein